MQFQKLVLALVWASVSYIIYLLNLFFASWQESAKARELKCGEPVWQKNRYPFGIDNLMSAVKADNQKLFPLDSIQRTVDNGAMTYKYAIFGSKSAFTADPKNIQAMLSTQFDDFDLGPTRNGNFWPLLGNGIFTQDGPAWEHSRTMMRPQFAREQVSDLDLEEKHVQNMIRVLDLKLKDDHWTDIIDLQVLFFNLTIDSATEFLFGESVESQLHLLPGYAAEENRISRLKDIDFATAFDVAQRGIAIRARFAEVYWMVSPKGFKKSCKACHEFIDHFVRLALSKDIQEEGPRKGVAGTKDKYVFLDALVAQTRDPIELRSQLLHILLAGRDSTASLLGWLFMCLSQDPARYQKLRDSIICEFGTFGCPSEITFAKLKNCKYLQHCNNEALRLYPIVPINQRYANKDTTLPRGGGKDGMERIFIPAGTNVDYSVHVMHHRKDLWGEDAEDFRPERWEGRKVGWEFLPFNGGPRICIGQQFALTEASYVTVRLLQRFDKLECMETDPIIKHNLTLTNCPANGTKVKAHAA